MKNRKLRFFAISALLLLSFQNCGKKLEVNLPSQGTVFQQAHMCFNSKAPNQACLFKKSPVTQAGHALAIDEVGAFQSYAAEIQNFQSPRLENSNFQILTINSQRLDTATGLRQSYDPKYTYTEQLSAYYYIQEMHNWLILHGVTQHQNQNFKVYVDSSFTGFVASRKELHLQRSDGRLSAALDGNIVQHLYAEAAIWTASGGLSHQNLGSTTRSCVNALGVLNPASCCQTDAGCGAAAISGASDLLTTIYFEKVNPAFGDGWKNDPAGLSVCGLNRTPNPIIQTLRSSAFNACTARGSAGQISAMGILYSSIWSQARQQAMAAGISSFDFDHFFSAHLGLISGADTFVTLKAKILNLDATQFGSKYSAFLTAAFQSRGY